MWDGPQRSLRPARTRTCGSDAQKRECDGLIVFHAGKAIETSLHVIYARINNRILGREYPNQMRQDRRTHSLAALYDDILNSDETKKPGLRKELADEFESVYQTAFHKGVQDLIVDNELVHRFFLVEDAPFREARMGGVRHGAAITMDNSSFRQLLMPPEDETDFSRLPCGNFREFLAKADVVYYGGHNMRWAHYSARDHERGRPYVVVGTRFFARLVQGLVGMANEQWMWDERFAARWHERRGVIVRDMVRANSRQSFTGEPDLPDLKPVEEMMESFRSKGTSRNDDYDSIHVKWKFNRAAKSSGTDDP